MTIIYIHGFRSSGNSDKVRQLREYFTKLNEPIEILSPTLDPNPTVAIEQLVLLVKESNGPVIAVGTSLGGFYSLYLATMYRAVAFAINPSLDPDVTLVEKVGKHTRYDEEESEYDFKAEYLHSLKFFKEQIMMADKSSFNYRFYLAEDDEVLTFNNLDERFTKRHTLKTFANAGHRFTAFPAVIPDIKETIDELRLQA